MNFPIQSNVARITPWLTRAGCLALATTVSIPLDGCRTQETSDGVYDATAAVVGELAINDQYGEAALSASIVAVANGDVPLGLRAGAEGSFAGTRAGASITLDVTCQSAAGRTTSCEEPGVDGARATASVAGDISGRRFRGAVSQSASLSVSGLESGALVLEGTNDLTIDAQATGTFFNGDWSFEYSASYESVRLSPTTGLPTSGRIQYRIDADRRASGTVRNVEQSYSFDATLTFGADGATLVIDGDHSYSLDLEGEAIVRI